MTIWRPNHRIQVFAVLAVVLALLTITSGGVAAAAGTSVGSKSLASPRLAAGNVGNTNDCLGQSPQQLVRLETNRGIGPLGSVCSTGNRRRAPSKSSLKAGTISATTQASSSSEWTLQNPPGNSFATGGLSCLSTMCFAAGATVGATSVSGNAAIATEPVGGSSWTITVVGSAQTEFTGISCVSTSFCVAVGSGLIATWNGSTWVTANAPSNGDLVDVSCPTTTSCTAVGFGGPGGQQYQDLIVSLVGGNWTTTYASPVTSNYNVLFGVSCPTPTNCFAVGENQPDAVIFAGVLTGTTWNWSAKGIPNVGTYAGLRVQPWGGAHSVIHS